MKLTRGQRVFTVFNFFILLGVCLITLYPLWYTVIASFSDPLAVSTGRVTVLPIGFELASFKKVFEMDNIWTAYGNTIFYAVVGTFINMVLTILGAYPLSKRRLRGRKLFMLFILITMWFNAGMMPTFLNYQDLHLFSRNSCTRAKTCSSIMAGWVLGKIRWFSGALCSRFFSLWDLE